MSDNNNAEVDTFTGKTYYMSESLFENLKGMGFTEVAIHKSIIAGCINEDTCTQWISMHLDHPELNTPLESDVRVLIKVKVVLTAEEKEKKIQELKDKIAATKNAESAAAIGAETAAEKSRIAQAKAMLEAKELRDEEQRKAIRYQKAKEKEADQKAKDRVQLQIAVDKLVRKGMSTEDAEKKAQIDIDEAKQKRREEAEAAMKAEAASQPPPKASAATSSSGAWDVARVLGTSPAAAAPSFEEPTELPSPTQEGFASLLSNMKESQKDSTVLANTINTLRTIIANVIGSPLDSKKRNIKMTSNVYLSKVAPTKYALSYLRLSGFDVGTLDDNTSILVMNTVILRRLHLALSAIDN